MSIRQLSYAVALGLFFCGSAFGQYRTPGTGVVYTLEDLASLAGDVLEQEDIGLVLHDQLTISASDELVVAGGELLVSTTEMRERIDPITGHPYEWPIAPVIYIEGTLTASDWTIRCIPGAVEYAFGHGLVVSGLGHGGAARATITNCTFERLGLALSVRGGGSATVEASRFLECSVSGAVTYMDGDLSVTECFFQNCGVDVSSPAKIRLENSHIEGAGITLNQALEGSTISGCTVLGKGGTGLHVSGETGAQITQNRLGGFDYGVFFSHAATGRLEDNVIWGNHESAVVFADGSTPVLRRNQVIYNALKISSAEGQYPRGAILIMDTAQPDLGTEGDPGLNFIRYNGGVSLYHMGSEPISAQGNDWGEMSESAVEDLIYHQPDDGDDADGSGFVSGLVAYTPIRNLDPVRPTPDLDLSGVVDPRDLLLFQREWHESGQ